MIKKLKCAVCESEVELQFFENRFHDSDTECPECEAILLVEKNKHAFTHVKGLSKNDKMWNKLCKIEFLLKEKE